MNIKSTKTYKIVDFKEETPVYFKGVYPKVAGVKAFQHLLKFIDIKNFEDKFIVFKIEEVGPTTNNKLLKTYKYIGTRIELEKPAVKVIDGLKTTYYFKDVVGKYNPELDKI
jgi:hypothetical protein